MIDWESAVLLLDWDRTTTSLRVYEPDGYLHEHTGEVIASGETDGPTTVLGRFKAIYVNVDAAVNDKMSIFDVFDSEQRTLDYYEVMYDSGVELNENFAELLDGCSEYGNVLILDRLEILPEFRKRGLGLAVMRAMIERLSPGAFVIAIKPFPLQFEPARVNDSVDEWRQRLELSSFDLQQETATDKLTRYYSKLGFVRLSGTPYMFRSTDWVLPPAREFMSELV